MRKVAILFLLGCSTEALSCKIPGPVPSPEALLDAASVIVHVRAIGQTENPNSENGPESSATLVQFEALGVLKGEALSGILSFNGNLADIDDFNDEPVPYGFVRPGGRSGNCYALEYRLGAEYLLFLSEKQASSVWTPYWSPLAPVNEQIEGLNDPWFVWVTQKLEVQQ